MAQAKSEVATEEMWKIFVSITSKKKKIEQLTKNSVMLTLLGTNIPDTFENKIMH